MYNTLRTHIKLIATVFLLICITACGRSDTKQKELTSVLQTSFDCIYYAKYALDFPHTEHALKKCIQYNNKPCINVYNLFIEGKSTLLSLSPDKTLDITLDIIENACLSKDELIANFSFHLVAGTPYGLLPVNPCTVA